MSIYVYFKGGSAIINLVDPKDNITHKSEIIYRYKCAGMECDEYNG